MRGERDETCAPGSRQVAPIAERLRRNPDQQVASDAARDANHDREDDDAEDVQAGLNAGESTAESEDERSGQVEDEQQGRVETMQNTGRHPVIFSQRAVGQLVRCKRFPDGSRACSCRREALPPIHLRVAERVRPRARCDRRARSSRAAEQPMPGGGASAPALSHVFAPR